MSTISTTLAAGVAQSAHNAEKLARQQDKRRVDRDADRAEFSEKVAEQVESPVDANETDDQLPDRQAPGYEQLYAPAGDPNANDVEPAKTNEAEPDTTVETFRHIDISA
ncbi:MAG: hypothetical protein AAGH92_05185 [Planctomycetota bacterium]